MSLSEVLSHRKQLGDLGHTNRLGFDSVGFIFGVPLTDHTIIDARDSGKILAP
jgi:hypothetical protein